MMRNGSSSPAPEENAFSSFYVFSFLENGKWDSLCLLETYHSYFPTIAFWNVKGIAFPEQQTINKWVVTALDLSLERFSGICQL